MPQEYRDRYEAAREKEEEPRKEKEGLPHEEEYSQFDEAQHSVLYPEI